MCGETVKSTSEKEFIPREELLSYIDKHADQIRLNIKNDIRQMIQQEMVNILNLTFERLGVDPSEAAEMRRDFGFLRNQRKTSEKIGFYVKTVVIGLAITAAASAFLMGIADKVKEMVK